MSNLDHTCLPAVELLQYIKTVRDKNPDEVPFVEVGSLCIADWSK